MADYKQMVPWIKKWEGGWANDPDDAGGCTMMGITIVAYQKYFGRDKTCSDLRNITNDEWTYIFTKGYWDRMKADYIASQAVAEICVQMCWGSGPATAIKKIQKLLGCKQDGIVGPITLRLLNSEDEITMFNKLYDMRKAWLEAIAKKGNNKKFLRGWLNRLEDLRKRHFAK